MKMQLTYSISYFEFYFIVLGQETEPSMTLKLQNHCFWGLLAVGNIKVFKACLLNSKVHTLMFFFTDVAAYMRSQSVQLMLV